MIQYIHKKLKKKKSSLIITTPLLKMYTQREQCGGRKGVVSADPQLNPSGGTATKNMTINCFKKSEVVVEKLPGSC